MCDIQLTLKWPDPERNRRESPVEKPATETHRTVRIHGSLKTRHDWHLTFTSQSLCSIFGYPRVMGALMQVGSHRNPTCVSAPVLCRYSGCLFVLFCCFYHLAHVPIPLNLRFFVFDSSLNPRSTYRTISIISALSFFVEPFRGQINFSQSHFLRILIPRVFSDASQVGMGPLQHSALEPCLMRQNLYFSFQSLTMILCLTLLRPPFTTMRRKILSKAGPNPPI
jgi:hypothetical protein